ncbi:MAG TPA: GGDEF domain-containing protein [Thermoleophilaceae bacterium]
MRSGLSTSVTAATRLGAVASLLAAIGGLLIWTADPGSVRSPAIMSAGIVVSALVGGAYVFLPWQRMRRRAALLPLVVLGVPGIAIAAYNTGGMESPYTYYFVFIPFTAALITTRRELAFSVAACAVGAAVPLAYDGSSTSNVVLLLFLLTISTATGIVFHRSQEHVRASDARLRDMALRDSLTGVANRRALEVLAANALLAAARDDRSLSVCYMDIDRFKEVNDSLGHAVGDRVLEALARSTRKVLREEDVVGRLGGDEFAVVLPRAGADQADLVAARIAEAFAEEVAEELLPVSVTVGRATFPQDGRNWEELLHTADKRLLHGKHVREPGQLAVA